MEHQNITFIGCGNMGRCLIGGLINNGYPADNISGTDINAEQRELTARHYNIEVLADNEQALRHADIVVLAVKPQAVHETLLPLRPLLAESKPLLLSIAAGVRLHSLERWAGESLAIVRVMPNTPSLVNAGAAGLCSNANVTEQQHDIAETIMRSVGITTWVEDEKLLDAVTAVSGSGPAYFFYFMEILQKTAEELGLSAEQAGILTIQTALGAARMALESEYDPATLRQQVTSPGGTTEQALSVMREENIDRAFADAIRAACKRSEELAGILGEGN